MHTGLNPSIPNHRALLIWAGPTLETSTSLHSIVGTNETPTTRNSDPCIAVRVESAALQCLDFGGLSGIVETWLHFSPCL